MPGRDIFLSYSSRDEAIVGLTLEKLEAAGNRCWFAPRDIPAGEFYAGQIIQALRESRFVLLFFSFHSNSSEQVVREINFAVGQRLPILVVRLDQTALSNHFEYLIRINQWLDVTQLSSDAERIARIVAQVEASFAKSGPRSSSAKAPVAMIFGDFEILADSSGKPIELGRGGMGVTYRARQISMSGREVALKVIQPEFLGDDNIRRRFLREAKLAGDLDHENIALVYSRGQEGDSFYYAMQLVPGTDLDRYVKANGPLSVREALAVTVQVASALEAANAKGLIHRDIKPSNLMVLRRRTGLRVKLIDFGLAKHIRQSEIQSSIVSGRDEFKGTLAFASPEQCKSLPLDTRSDLYSLGVTLWFLLIGKVPFRGSVAEVSGAHIYAPPPIKELNSLPVPVVELLETLLSKNPVDRLQTPAELHDRIQDLLVSLPAESASDPVQPAPAVGEPNPTAADPSTTLIGAPALLSYLEPTVGQMREDRFELLESFPEGVSGRLFRARERRGSEARIVAVKFLHPSICAQQEAAESLKTQFAALQKLTLDHLVRYFGLEIGAEPPFLVHEWVHGIPLTGLLRLKAGILTPPEVAFLLEPLSGLLDALASSGLSLIAVRLSKLWTRVPPDLETAKLETWVKQTTPRDWDSRLALDPLSLRGLVARSIQAESDVTLLPTSRSLALQQNRAGIQGRAPAQLLASVVYELLAGQPPRTDAYRPVAVIPENANQRLKNILAQEGPDQSSASELWVALKVDFPEGPKARTPTRHEQPKPALSTGATSSTPAKPPNKPRPSPTPAHSGIQKTNRARLWLILCSLALFVGILLFGSWLSSHRWPPQPSPTPTPKPTVAPSPTPIASLTPGPSVSPTPTAASTPTPSNDELANVALDRGTFAQMKGDLQTAIADYSEAIRLKPDWLAYYNRAQCYEALGKKVEAKRDREKAEELEKGSPSRSPFAAPTPILTNGKEASAAFNRGNAAVGTGDNQQAVADYSEAIRLKPDHAFAFNNRGNVYSDLKQYDKAIADYSDYIQLRPDDPDGYNNRAHCYEQLGNTYAAERDRARAKELSDNANGPSLASETPTTKTTPTPTNSPALTGDEEAANAAFSRGNTAVGNGDNRQAIADYSEAIRLKPDYAFAFNNRGNVYSDLKQYDKAIADYSNYIRLRPNDPDGYNNRARCYEEIGNTYGTQRDRARAKELSE
jgi:serine/threonine protein kinase/regulator of sirC expression with transglutaminase-like and TPR domain